MSNQPKKPRYSYIRYQIEAIDEDIYRNRLRFLLNIVYKYRGDLEFLYNWFNNLTSEQMRAISVYMCDGNVSIVNLDESGYHHDEYILIRRSFANSNGARYDCYEPNQYPPLHEQPIRIFN